MRRLAKLRKPSTLAANEVGWLAAYKADPENKTKRYRYRNAEIKQALTEETGFKCVYCESKIGHNTPGDIEHKIPSSKDIDKHFDWPNLTVACTQCNRRKNDYYSRHTGFLDPYVDDVEAMLDHLGPVVHAAPGETRAEVAVKILDLHGPNRVELILFKTEKLEAVANLVERHYSEQDPALKQVLHNQMLDLTGVTREYSAMVISALRQKHIL